MRILVVDDSGVDRKCLKALLVELGHEVRLAESAGRALVELEQGLDLLMLDWNMPDLDGIEFLKQLRLTHSAEALPVVMVTGMATQHAVAEALAAGANEFLIKPASKEAIEAKLALVVETRAARL